MICKNSALAIFLTGFFIILILISYLLLPPFIKNNGQIRLRIGEAEFSVDVANNGVSRAKGLSGRESLGEDEGMLFIFEKSSTYSFWMKGMLFPLDIIWINDGRVVDVSENLPPAVFPELKTYSPAEPAKLALEVNAGLVKKFGIKKGDAVNVFDGVTEIIYN